MKSRSAIDKINQHGILLVFPLNNRKEPHSLWSAFHPRTPLKWEWDDDGDGRVFAMWRLMKELSSCREVVYSKWYQGRATFFSRDLFTALLCLFVNFPNHRTRLLADSNRILSELESDSPLSTKDLKRLTELQGKFNEPIYNKSMKELFSRFLIIAFGEVDDGAFPSLAVGATSVLYEDLWQEAQQMPVKKAQTLVDKFMPEGTHFRKYFDKISSVL